MSGRGAHRILAIVEWMAKATGPVSFIEVVSGLALPKSSALDLLRILVEAGYVKKTEDGRYVLVRCPGEPNEDGLGLGVLLRHADRILRHTVELTQESGFVAVLTEDLSVRYIQNVLPEREIRYDRDVSVTRRPHLVSSGIILLGDFPEKRLREYVADERAAERFDGFAEDLIKKVSAAKISGFQCTTVGVVEGAGGMAAPIHGRGGQIIAALNIAGPADRIAKAADTIEPILREAAAKISRSLAGEQQFHKCS